MEKVIAYFLFLAAALALVSCNNSQRNAEEDPLFSDDHEYLQKSFDEMVASYESPERENWQNPNYLLGAFDYMEEKTVADLGAGTGYFTFRLAPLVQKIIAIDVDQRFLDFIDARARLLPDEIAGKIETRLAEYHDPKLEPEEVDFILIVNTYHLIEDRVDYFQRLKKTLRDNGQIIIVDFKKELIPIGPPPELKVSSTQVIEELKKAGYSQFEVDIASLEYQYIITAQ